MVTLGMLVLVPACARSATEAGVAECEHYAKMAVCASSAPESADAIRAIEEGCHDKLAEAESRGDGCHAEYLEALECITALDCDAFEVWLVHDTSSPCHAAWARVEGACGDLPLEPQLGVPG